MDKKYEPTTAIIVRSKNDQQYISRLLDVIKKARETYSGRIDMVFVDTESHDATPDHARQFGASVVSISQNKFTYPKSLNIGLSSIAEDVEAAFLTVGHAVPTSSNFIKSGVRHFKDPKVSGVYGITVPDDTASRTEKLFAAHYKNEVRNISHVSMGVFGATNAMIRMAAWREHPFDETFAGGGEDTEWARQALKRGESIIFESGLNVRHSHGLGPIGSVRQWLHWRKVFRGPTALERSKLTNK